MNEVAQVLDVTEQMVLLRGKADQVEELVTPPRSEPDRRPADVAGPDPVQRRLSWYRDVEDAVLDLSASLPEGTEDYDARKLFEFLVGLRRAVAPDPGRGDERGDGEQATTMMRDVVRRIGRRLEHGELDDPSAAARSIFATLRGIGVGDLSRLLGVSTKTVNTWKAGRPVARNAARAVVVAQLLTYLRASMTAVGVVMWFDAPREQLAGRTPLQLLDADQATARETLLALARGARGQLAS